MDWEERIKFPDIFDLSGKKAIVTGGSRGLGAAMALALARAGADLIVVARGEEELASRAERLRELSGREVTPVTADLTRLEDIERLVATAMAQWGKIDILVNNAGYNRPQPAVEFTEENWDKTLDINLKGLFFTAQAVGREMIKRRYGKIININSQMGFVALYDRAAYCASKGGVAQLTRALAVEWAPYNVNVNGIAPTFFETAMTIPLLADEKFRQEVLSRIPMGRLGRLDELAGTVIYLASDASSMVTGHTVMVDGGWTIW
ncbi:MAG: glucose 1-dehydrogenase [Firmicutes bacterium]|jgi:NAD(P)-dependent dehydrogenase (short-subunit alcohol dehydrogenase family)|nr:glucose 1-dehydrogenase [Bacillota bacterium]